MKNVILIGDSIRLGYDAYVRELLGEHVAVYSPADNCRWTKYTLWNMPLWMNGWEWPKVDVIHWNTGIWDLHRHMADGEPFTPLYQYLDDNRRLAIQMASYCDRLIWANIIPGGKALDENKPFCPLINTNPNSQEIRLCVPQEQWNRDVRRYNEATAQMLRMRDVQVNDLYTVLAADTEKYISSDGIHPTEEGYRALAAVVAEKILAALE